MLALALKEIDAIKEKEFQWEKYLYEKDRKLAHVMAILLDYEWAESLETIRSLTLTEKVYIAEEAISFGRSELITELIGDSIEVAVLLFKNHPEVDYIKDTISYYREIYSDSEYMSLLNDTIIGFENKLRGFSSLDLSNLSIENDGLNLLFTRFHCHELEWSWMEDSKKDVELLLDIEGDSFVIPSWFHLLDLNLEYIEANVSHDSSFLNSNGRERSVVKEGAKWVVRTAIGLIPVAGNIVMGAYDAGETFMDLPETQEILFLRITKNSFNREEVYNLYKMYLKSNVEAKIPKASNMVVNIKQSFELFEKDLVDYYLSNMSEKEIELIQYYQMINRKEASYRFIRSKIEDRIDQELDLFYNNKYEV